MKPAELRAYDTGKKTTSILSANHYGWFQRIDHGIYQLTDQGKTDLAKYPEIVARCEQKLRELRRHA